MYPTHCLFQQHRELTHARQVHPLNHTHWAPSTNGKESPVPMHKQGGAQRPLHHRPLHPPWRGSEDVWEGVSQRPGPPGQKPTLSGMTPVRGKQLGLPASHGAFPPRRVPHVRGPSAKEARLSHASSGFLAPGHSLHPRPGHLPARLRSFVPRMLEWEGGRVCPVPGGRVWHARWLRSAGAFTRGRQPGRGLTEVLRGSHQPSALRSDTPGSESPSSEQALAAPWP